MTTSASFTSDAALFFAERDEMAAAYATALGRPIRWIEPRDVDQDYSLDRAPVAVILDLDGQPGWGDEELTRFRTRFGRSGAIALSTSDSAQLAMQCLRCGFDDFLLKPISPEELAWAVRKVQERRELARQMEDPRAALVGAATRLSTCTHPALVRLNTIETLIQLFGAQGAAWIEGADRVVSSLPRTEATESILFRLPAEEKPGTRVLRSRNGKHRKIVLPCEESSHGKVFLWEVPTRVPRRSLADARLLLRHAETSLQNLTRLAEVKQRTFLDDLTGLYNARYLRFALANAVTKSRSAVRGLGTGRFAVLFIDVDHFKAVNDRNGHLVGSEFLIAIGKTIKNAVRAVDTVFRYGGDEFVVILHGAGLRESHEIAERIRRGVEHRVFVLGQIRVQTTVSIGLAVYPDTAADLDTLLELADEAMYAAKKESRNSVRLAMPGGSAPPTEPRPAKPQLKGSREPDPSLD